MYSAQGVEGTANRRPEGRSGSAEHGSPLPDIQADIADGVSAESNQRLFDRRGRGGDSEGGAWTTHHLQYSRQPAVGSDPVRPAERRLQRVRHWAGPTGQRVCLLLARLDDFGDQQDECLRQKCVEDDTEDSDRLQGCYNVHQTVLFPIQNNTNAAVQCGNRCRLC